MKAKITIIDYGVGNTHSVKNALQFLGYKVSISNDKKEIEESEVLILPGVGAFDEAMKNIKSRGLDIILNEQVLERKKPILGICVGMQMLASFSEENGIHPGLNWIEGKVVKFQLPTEYAVPHVGWNDVSFNQTDPLFSKNPDQRNFYFDHSYHFVCDEKYISAYCNYSIKVAASVQKDNIFGVQFHPEKSQTSGLKMFRSFFNSI